MNLSGGAGVGGLVSSFLRVYSHPETGHTGGQFTAQGDGVMKVLQNRNTTYSWDKICHVYAMGVEGWAKASKRRLLKEEKELDRRTLLARRCCFQRGIKL